ncbi:MAG: NAD(P)H-binding protein [Elusimicrobia bacterium]|nr:NAD(P)H-binding protein [Elusimicrobiota bacterium]
MEKFGFIAHLLKIENLYKQYGILKIIPEKILVWLLKWAPSFKISKITGIKSITGKEIEGYLILCPLLPQQMLSLDDKFVVRKVIQAGKIAEKAGAKIIGLGAYTSVVGDKGFLVANNLKIPVTSGSSFTAWAVLEAINRAAKNKDVDLSKSAVAIIGASGSIGSLCVRKLASQVKKIIITARHLEKLEKLKEVILKIASLEVQIEGNAHKAVAEADLVITTTSAPESLLDLQEFKSGAIVCDVSVPQNVGGKAEPERKVTLIKGGLFKAPVEVEFGIDVGLPKNIVYACMAETMILTLEGKYISYSLGDNIALEQLDGIGEMVQKHGFDIVLSSD